jgi:hypothetical protein
MSMTKQVCSCKVSDNGYVFRLHTPDCPTQSKPNRVEIWRYNEQTITVALSDGSCFNASDSEFRVGWKHEGIWNSLNVQFIPRDSDHFTDGTPVALYEDELAQPNCEHERLGLRGNSIECHSCRWQWKDCGTGRERSGGSRSDKTS